MAYGESNGHVTDKWSRDRWRHATTKRSDSWPQCVQSPISQKQLEMLF